MNKDSSFIIHTSAFLIMGDFFFNPLPPIVSHCDDEKFIETWLRWGKPGTVREQLDGKVAGDSIEVLVWPVIPRLESGASRTITKAWLSVKAKETASDATENDPWGAAGARQTITTTEVSGRGQILDDSDTGARLRFDITPANSGGLTTRKLYYFDVQVLMSDDSIYTVERGMFTFKKGITNATS